MDPNTLRQENERLRQQNARLQSALDDIRARLVEPTEIVRAIRDGEVDALVIQEQGREELYSLQRFDSVYRTVVEECFPYGVWLAEADGRLLYVTPAFLNLLGTGAEEIRAKGQFHFLPSGVREAIERKWAECRECRADFDAEYMVRLANGTERVIWTHGIFARTHDGMFRWVGVNIDVTERERLKEELRQQAEALRLADRNKDEFLATLGHELRNPLAPLRNALEILRRAGDNPAQVEHVRGVMERQLQRLMRLVDDLLDSARISRGKVRLNKERIELAAVVQGAVEAARAQIESRAHALAVSLPDEPIHLEADPSRLTQVFANLLDNAAKYTERGGRIWLVAERRGAEAVVSVRDTGIGIAPEHLPTLFELFSQVAPALERSQGGLGIGLSLVKGLVELHGGRVEVHSAGPGAGTEFRVRLPVTERAPSPAPGPDPTPNQVLSGDLTNPGNSA